MFGKGKKELDELQLRVAELEQENQNLKSMLTIAATELSDLNIQHKENLRGFNDIEKTILDGSVNREAIEKDMKVIKRGLSLLLEKDENAKSVNQDEEDRWNQLSRLLEDYSELKEKKMNYLGSIKNPSAKIEKSVDDLEELVLNLQNIAKSMSVASLNSAIEAGHLGEQGVRYVETAEKMRTMSEEYKQKAEIAAKTLMDIKDGFYQSRDGIIKLEDTFLREDSELKRISEETETFLAARQKQNGMEESFSAEGLVSELENLEGNLAEMQERMANISEKFKYTISNSEKNDTELERILGGLKDGEEK